MQWQVSTDGGHSFSPITGATAGRDRQHRVGAVAHDGHHHHRHQQGRDDRGDPEPGRGGSGLRVGGSNAVGSGGRPARGGRLYGTVAAWVRLCSVPGAGARASSAPFQTVTAVPPQTLTSPSSTLTPSSSTFSPRTKVPFVDPARGPAGCRRRARSWRGSTRRSVSRR